MQNDAIIPERLIERREKRGLSQTGLARAVGQSQQAISRLESGEVRESKRLHRIAEEVGTTTAYLTGKTDDPDEGAPPPPPPPAIQYVTMPIALPSERALARMFEGLLRTIAQEAGGELTMDEQAQQLAQLLPIGLSQLQDLLPAEAMVNTKRPQRRTTAVP